MAPPTGSAKPVKKWDDTMVAHLFFSIYNTVDISFTPENKVAIETMMKDKFNHDVNWNGIRQHLQKLKKKDGDKKDGDAPATPKKPKVPAGRAKNLTASGQKKRKQVHVDEDEDEDEDKVYVKKLKLEAQAPNFGQYHEAEPNPPSDGEI